MKLSELKVGTEIYAMSVQPQYGSYLVRPAIVLDNRRGYRAVREKNGPPTLRSNFQGRTVVFEPEWVDSHGRIRKSQHLAVAVRDYNGCWHPYVCHQNSLKPMISRYESSIEMQDRIYCDRERQDQAREERRQTFLRDLREEFGVELDEYHVSAYGDEDVSISMSGEILKELLLQLVGHLDDTR